MAGTITKVRLEGRPGDYLYEIAKTLNQLIADYDAHKHKTPTTNPGTTSTPVSDASGSGSTGGTAFATTASPIGDPTGTAVS